MTVAHDAPPRLSDTYLREGLSLLQYVRQAAPFASRADRPLAVRIKAMAEAEFESLEKMARQLSEARKTVPSIGGFPSVFTNFNFFEVRKLLPHLIADHSRLISQLQLETTATAGASAMELLNQKAIHLTEMTNLTTIV